MGASAARGRRTAALSVTRLGVEAIGWVTFKHALNKETRMHLGLRFTSVLVVGVACLATAARAAPPGAGAPRFAFMDNDECWQLLGLEDVQPRPTLPNWARATARSLRRTTIAMIDLDRIHRTRSPLGPLLRAQMRWIAADANRSPYGKAYAEADLRRAGIDAVGIAALAGSHAKFSEEERAALDFAREMTLDASRVTDEQVANLIQMYGEKKVVAMVLLLAFSNFQDRLLLALDVPVEAGGPLEPLTVRAKKGGAAPAVPARARNEDSPAPAAPERVQDPDWLAFDYEQLQKNLDSQRANEGRIRIPSWEEVLKVLPEGYPVPRQPSKIKWSLVCMGYQPELAAAWSATTRAFREEAQQDRVFEESLFWVVTRTIHCFY